MMHDIAVEDVVQRNGFVLYLVCAAQHRTSHQIFYISNFISFLPRIFPLILSMQDSHPQKVRGQGKNLKSISIE